MKKMINLMTAVIATLTFYACASYDNPVTPSDQTGKAVITVNTAALYQEAGVADLMESYLTHDLCISDTVLIYDQNGRLVTKVGTATKNLEPLTLVVDDLPNGTYTLVGWQGGYFEDFIKPFILTDEEELSTIKLVQLDEIHTFATANGLAYATVTVDNNSFETTISPKLVGSILNLKSEKSPNEYGVEEIDLYRMDQVCQGLYLDPTRSEDDRWIVSQNKNHANSFAFIAEEETEFPHYTFEHGDDMPLAIIAWKYDGEKDEYKTLAYGYQKLKNGSNATYYFDLDRISYQPPFLGPTDQLAAWKADRDAGILVNDPYLKWGGNIAEVEAHRQAQQFWYEGNYKLEIWEGYGWHRWYCIANSLTEQYIFETEDGQNLIGAMCVCYDENVPIDIFTKSLQLQGYTYLGQVNDPDDGTTYEIFQSADGKTNAAVYANSYGGWIVDYYQADSTSNTARGMVPDMRRSSARSATMRNDLILRPAGKTRRLAE